MSSWSTLPLELLTEILTLIHSQHYQSLCDCQLTCRSWSKPAQSLLYSTVKLNTPQQANIFLAAVITTNTNHTVKDVNLGTALLDSPAFEKIFPKLFESCPNIIHLIAERTDMAFWTKLLREFYKGNMNYIKTLPQAYFNEDEDIKIYGYTACALSATLSSIYIQDWPLNNPSFQNSEVAQNLSSFSNLESLFVDVGGIETVLDVFSLIQGCSKLQKIRIKTNNYRKISYTETDDDDMNDINVPTPLPNITTLQIDSITITKNLIRNLMHVFPRLTNFKMNAIAEEDNNDNDWELEDKYLLHRYQVEGWKISADLWVEFLQHIYNYIPEFHLSKLFISDIADVLERFTDATKFQDSILELIYVRRRSHFEIKPYVEIASSYGGGRNIAYRGTSVDKCGQIKVIFGNNSETLDHVVLLDRLGHRLKVLRIRIHQSGDYYISNEEMEDEILDIIDGFFLDHIFKSCPQLNTLWVDRARIYRCNPVLEVNISIEVLRLSYCSINPSVLTEISKRLPKLVFLTVINSDFIPSSGHILDSTKNAEFNMPYTSLNALIWQNFGRLYNDTTTLHLKISKGSKTSFFIIKKSSNKLVRSSSKSFGASLDNRSHLSIYIKCANIENFVLHTKDFNIHLRFSDLKILKGSTYQGSIKELNNPYLSSNK